MLLLCRGRFPAVRYEAKDPVARQDKAKPLPRELLQFLRAPALCEFCPHCKIVLLDRLKAQAERCFRLICSMQFLLR